MRCSCPPRRGDMLISRMVLLCCILLAMLVVPLYLWKQRDNEQAARDATERAMSAPRPAASAAPGANPPAAVNDPDRFGLTFGWVQQPAADRLQASCAGQPRDMGNPHRDACNPYAGDTSCRTVLPVLCIRAVQGGAPGLATASSVAGFLLASQGAGDARCAKDLGPGWRMATFRDREGWALQGTRLPGTFADTGSRAWIANGAPEANCWDRS